MPFFQLILTITLSVFLGGSLAQARAPKKVASKAPFLLTYQEYRNLQTPDQVKYIDTLRDFMVALEKKGFRVADLDQSGFEKLIQSIAQDASMMQMFLSSAEAAGKEPPLYVEPIAGGYQCPEGYGANTGGGCGLIVTKAVNNACKAGQVSHSSGYCYSQTFHQRYQTVRPREVGLVTQEINPLYTTDYRPSTTGTGKVPPPAPRAPSGNPEVTPTTKLPEKTDAGSTLRPGKPEVIPPANPPGKPEVIPTVRPGKPEIIPPATAPAVSTTTKDDLLNAESTGGKATETLPPTAAPTPTAGTGLGAGLANKWNDAMDKGFKSSLLCIYAGFPIQGTATKGATCNPKNSHLSPGGKTGYTCLSTEDFKKTTLGGTAEKVIAPKAPSSSKAILCNPMLFGLNTVTDPAEPICIGKAKNATAECKKISDAARDKNKDAFEKERAKVIIENPKFFEQTRATIEHLCSGKGDAEVLASLKIRKDSDAAAEAALADIKGTCQIYQQQIQ